MALRRLAQVPAGGAVRRALPLALGAATRRRPVLHTHCLGYFWAGPGAGPVKQKTSRQGTFIMRARPLTGTHA